MGRRKRTFPADDCAFKERFGSRKPKLGFPGGVVIKNLPASAGDIRDTGLMPESGRSPGVGNDSPLQYSCLGEFHGQRSLVGYGP